MKSNFSKGKFVVLEGGEACGKTSQISLLKSYFQHDDRVIFTREPGGTKIAEEIRNLVITGEKEKLLPETELALIYAARFEHLHKVILPALASKKLIISDRFFISSFVYQGCARNLSKEFIDIIHNLYLGNFTPDLTILLDLPYEEAKIRVLKRHSDYDERFEKFDESFHQKIRAGFLKYSQYFPNNIVISASKSASEIHLEILSLLEDL